MPEPWIILRVTDNQSDIRPPECIACLRPVRKRNIKRFTVEGMERVRIFLKSIGCIIIIYPHKIIICLISLRTDEKYDLNKRIQQKQGHKITSFSPVHNEWSLVWAKEVGQGCKSKQLISSDNNRVYLSCYDVHVTGWPTAGDYLYQQSCR